MEQGETRKVCGVMWKVGRTCCGGIALVGDLVSRQGAGEEARLAAKLLGEQRFMQRERSGSGETSKNNQPLAEVHSTV